MGAIAAQVLKGFGCKVVCRKPGAVKPTNVDRIDQGEDENDDEKDDKASTTTTEAPTKETTTTKAPKTRPSGGVFKPFPTSEDASCK